MPEIQIKNKVEYGKALNVLIEEGGTFNAFPGRVLSVSRSQYEALKRAGIGSDNGKGAAGRGTQKKTKVRRTSNNA